MNGWLLILLQGGDKVKAFDRICEVQSDKATVEITSRFAGTITKVHYHEGSIVKVGAALVDIDTGVASTASVTTAPAKAPASTPAPTPSKPVDTPAAASAIGVVPFKLADIGEGIAEVELLKWFVNVSNNVNFLFSLLIGFHHIL